MRQVLLQPNNPFSYSMTIHIDLLFFQLYRMVFTSSGPVRTTEVFALAITFSTAHSSVCLALKKLTCGSGDWSISLQGQTNKDQWGGVSVCACVCVFLYICLFLSLLTLAPAIPVIWYQDPVVCKSIQYSLQSLQAERKEGQERKKSHKLW